MILKLEDWPWAVVFLIHVHVLVCAFLITSWFSYVWHFRMGFETPYRVQAVLKMTSMNILVWKAFHPLILSAHRTVMEVLKQKIHLCFPALQRLLRIIPPLFTSPLGRVVWGVLEAKGGCPQDGKYSTLTCIWTTQETEKNYIYKQADTLSQSVTWNLGPVLQSTDYSISLIFCVDKPNYSIHWVLISCMWWKVWSILWTTRTCILVKDCSCSRDWGSLLQTLFISVCLINFCGLKWLGIHNIHMYLFSHFLVFGLTNCLCSLSKYSILMIHYLTKVYENKTFVDVLSWNLMLFFHFVFLKLQTTRYCLAKIAKSSTHFLWIAATIIYLKPIFTTSWRESFKESKLFVISARTKISSFNLEFST